MAHTSQVLGTAELLEAIMLQLPIRDAILVQRLCTTWRDAVNASPDLQRALFLRPEQQTSNADPRTADQIQDMRLFDSCNKVLIKKGTKSIFTSFLPIEKLTENSYKLIGGLPNGNEAASWQKMLMCMPARETEQFFFNSSNQLGMVSGEQQMSIILNREAPTTLPSGATIKYGKQFDLHAIQLEQAGGVTLGTFVEALRYAKERFEGARMKGRGFSIGWVRGELENCKTVRDFWLDMKMVADAELLRLQRMMDEYAAIDDDDIDDWLDDESDDYESDDWEDYESEDVD